ncbi:MAG: DUF454 domain-containing protein [Deltaproteobacteria bacterium]|nr:MAG: DUF454 domain-containing protein [Deltaproteobacteria bacterium]
MQRYLLLALGLISLGLGILGTILPLLPTTPFILLAAYLFSKSSDKLYKWLTQIPRFGKSINDWNENGVVSNKSKVLCVLMLILVAFYIYFLTKFTIFIKALITLTLFFAGLFVTSRPSGEENILRTRIL